MSRYTASEGRIKEDVIVGAPGLLASYTAVLQLDGLQAAIDEQGGIAYRDENGKVLFTTAPPLMYDAAGIPSEEIRVDLTIQGDTAYVTYTPDPAWMEASERVYPVVLDPLYTNTLSQIAQIDTYVHSGNTSSGQNDSTTTLYVGNKSVSGTRRPPLCLLADPTFQHAAAARQYLYHLGNLFCASGERHHHQRRHPALWSPFLRGRMEQRQYAVVRETGAGFLASDMGGQ